MGCDIHAYAEVYTDNEWKPAACQPVRETAFIWRNYTVFGALAGVRRDIVPIIKPRGLPETMSKFATEIFDIVLPNHYNLHHTGWLDFQEIYSHKNYTEYIQGSHFDKWLEYVTEPYLKLDCHRVIFGFDN